MRRASGYSGNKNLGSSCFSEGCGAAETLAPVLLTVDHIEVGNCKGDGLNLLVSRLCGHPRYHSK